MAARRRLGYYSGQRLKPIDWKKVDELLIVGCTGQEVAAAVDISYKVLVERCAQEKGIDWKDYRKLKDSIGKTQIRTNQHKRCDQGSDTMLKWLGQQRLGQESAEKKSAGVGSIHITIKYFVLDETDVAREIATEKLEQDENVYIDDASEEDVDE